MNYSLLKKGEYVIRRDGLLSITKGSFDEGSSSIVCYYFGDNNIRLFIEIEYR